MVSSRRVASPTSSLSSSGSSCEYPQACKTVVANGRKDFEQLSIDDDREVARRVLADLEGLYFDEDSSEESEDEYESSSEWGSETSPRSSRGKRDAGEITLEELTVAVNAAIEYHRPAKPVVEQPTITPKSKEDGNYSQKGEGHRRHAPRRHPQKDLSTVTSLQGDSVLEMFQDMLERKEKHFYALRATNVNAVARDNHDVVVSRAVKVNQQQQTTAYVMDQATETEECSHYQSLHAVFGVAEFDIPPLSSLTSAHSEYAATPSNLMRPIEVGPTLTDLTHSQTKHRPASESSWSSSSSSSATDSAFQSSAASERSGKSSTKSSRHRHNSTNSSSKASRTSPPSKRSASSNHSSRKSDQLAEQVPTIETVKPTDGQFALAQKEQADDIPDQTRVPSSPELVEWELDLSNFAL